MNTHTCINGFINEPGRNIGSAGKLTARLITLDQEVGAGSPFTVQLTLNMADRVPE